MKQFSKFGNIGYKMVAVYFILNMVALLLIGLFLSACSPEPTITTCTVFPETSTVHPVFKYPIKSDVLSLRVRFSESCLYSPLRPGCTGDWNKLIYFGDVNPHHNGAAFVWMPRNDSILIGWYCWLDRTAPAKSGRMGAMLTVPVGKWVSLEIDLSQGVRWNADGVEHYLPDRIAGRWVSQGWFGGADDRGCDCNAEGLIKYQIEIQ